MDYALGSPVCYQSQAASGRPFLNRGLLVAG